MKPTSILGRYLTRQIVCNFLIALAMVIGIIFLFEMVERLRRIAGYPDLGVWFAVQLSLAKMPKTIEQVFPFVMMIAAMATFWRLSKSSEFVVMRAAGVSIWSFLLPIVTATLVIGIINVALINPISAKMYGMFDVLERKMDNKNTSIMSFSKYGLWLREALSEDKTMVLQAKSLRQDKDKVLLYNMSIIEMNKQSQILRVIEAFAGLLKEGYFELKDVKVFEAGKEVLKTPSMRYNTILDIEKIEENFIEPEAISFWKLPEVISFYDKSGFAVQRHQMRFGSLLISPIFLVAMVLMAGVFALRPNNRRGGVMFLIVGGIVTGFSAYFLSQVVYAMGISGSLPVAMAIIAPSVIALSIAVSLLLHLEDG